MMKRRVVFFVFGICMLFILAVAFVLRMYMLSKYDFWFDEAVTGLFTYPFYQDCYRLIESARQLMPATFCSYISRYFLRILQQDFQPPFYYSFIYIYSFFFREEISLRFLSVIFGMLSLAIFYAVARKFLSKLGSLGALGIMSVSAFHIWYAQEARGYTMFCFFFLLTVYCFLRLRENNSKWYWVSFWATGFILMLSSYYAIFIFLLPGLYLLYKKKSIITYLHAMASAIILVLGLVLLFPLISKQLGRLFQGDFWLPPPLLRTFLLSPVVFVGGYVSQPWQMYFGLILCWVLILIGLRAFFNENKEVFLTIFVFSLLPVILIFMIARIWLPVYLDRHLIIFTPFYYILIVKGILSIKIKTMKVLSIFCLICFLWMALANFYRGTIYCYKDKNIDFYAGVHPRKQYMPLVKTMLSDLRGGDKIIVGDRQTFDIILYIAHFNPIIMDKLVLMFKPRFLSPLETKYLENMIPIWKLFGKDEFCAWLLIRTTAQVVSLKEFDRIWFVAYSWDDNNLLSRNAKELNKVFMSQYVQRKAISHKGFFIWLYENTRNVHDF